MIWGICIQPITPNNLCLHLANVVINYIFFKPIDDEDVETEECHHFCQDIPLYRLCEHLAACPQELESADNIVDVCNDSGT